MRARGPKSWTGSRVLKESADWRQQITRQSITGTFPDVRVRLRPGARVPGFRPCCSKRQGTSALATSASRSGRSAPHGSSKYSNRSITGRGLGPPLIAAADRTRCATSRRRRKGWRLTQRAALACSAGARRSAPNAQRNAQDCSRRSQPAHSRYAQLLRGTEVPAAAAQRPEQVGVVVRVRADQHRVMLVWPLMSCDERLDRRRTAPTPTTNATARTRPTPDATDHRMDIATNLPDTRVNGHHPEQVNDQTSQASRARSFLDAHPTAAQLLRCCNGRGGAIRALAAAHCSFARRGRLVMAQRVVRTRPVAPQRACQVQGLRTPASRR